MMAVGRATTPSGPEASTRTPAATVRPAIGNQARLRRLAPPALLDQATRNADGSADAPAQDTEAPAPAPAPAPEGSGDPEPAQGAPGGTSCTCAVASGPAYRPTGKVPVTVANGRRSADFSMSASFVNDPAKGKLPSCCHVRQYIRWDKTLASSFHGPPPTLPANTPPDTWVEDRDDKGKRYGHRSGPYSAPGGQCQDEYKTGSKQDMANGNVYCGHDAPFVPSSTIGKYDFQLKVVDSADAEIASSSIITTDWN